MNFRKIFPLNVKFVSVVLIMTLFLIAKPNIQKVSQFIIELIQKYDDTGKGVIPSKLYPNFLQQLFIKGYQEAQQQKQGNTKIINQQIKELLLLATNQFGTKYNKKQYVELQQFYMDLIKDFTNFLQTHEQYLMIMQTFFGDSNISNQQESDEQKEQEQGDRKQTIQL